jgi:energy-coupling factor transporter ATP-binding protein EcfA2
MRLRNESLRTGNLLVCFDLEDPRNNSSLLFLVEGTADITPLRHIESACRGLTDGDERFRWYTVANQLELRTVEPRLDSSRVTRLEVAEFQRLSPEELRALLAPAVAQLRRAEPVRFPSATRTEGSVAKGVDFLDREDELAELRRLLEAGRHVLLVAPRRSGKTSLLHRLVELLAPQVKALVVDVEKFRSVEAFAAELRVRASSQRFIEALKHARGHGWREVLSESLTTLAQGPGPLVLMLDELAWFLEELDRESAQALLKALDVAVTRVGARLVIAGSLDLERLARELRMELPGVFGALHRFPLPPLARPRLTHNLRRVLLGTGLVLERGDLEWLAENVDLAMPYPALRFLGHLVSVAHARPLSPEDLERELMDHLARTDSFAELEEQLQELAERESPMADGIKDALDRLALAGRPLDIGDVKALLGLEPEEQMSHFNWLVEHFPVSVEGGRVELASRLFRRYWRAMAGVDA